VRTPGELSSLRTRCTQYCAWARKLREPAALIEGVDQAFEDLPVPPRIKQQHRIPGFVIVPKTMVCTKHAGVYETGVSVWRASGEICADPGRSAFF